MNALEDLGYDLDDLDEIRDSCIPWEDNFDEVAFQVLGHGGWGYSSAVHENPNWKPDSGTPESVMAARYAHFYYFFWNIQICMLITLILTFKGQQL